MARYIDAERLLFVIEKNFGHTGGAAVMKDLIDMQPIADVQPIIHTKWETPEFTYIKSDCVLSCSNCNSSFGFPTLDDAFDYCPNCGAKRDKEIES